MAQSGLLAHGRPVPGPLWEGRTEGNAYVCRDGACELPATDAASLSARLESSRPT